MNTLPSTPTLSSELKLLIEERNVLTTRTKLKVVNALDNQIRLDQQSKKQQLKAKAIEEIFTSEMSYLNQLEIAMKYFKKPLLESKLPLPDSLTHLFENLESVYNVNGELLNQLRLHGEDVAGAFIKVAPFFKLYSVYAYQYRHGLSALQELPKCNCKLDALIKKQETRPEVGAKLGSILIAPIQRIPRYRLLLKELLNYTPKTHAHHSSIRDAIREVEKATEHINALVSDQENMERIIELQKSFVSGDPILICPGRKLIKEGSLMKISKKGKRPRQIYLILMSDVIVCCKMTGALFGEANSLRCSCILPLNRCLIHPGAKNFQIICNPVTLTLFSEQPYTMETWITIIKQAILKEQQNQETLKRKGSLRHFRIKDINSLSSSVVPKKRKQLEDNYEVSDCHSPNKKNKLSAGCSSNLDSSSENDENERKQLSYFSSVKKAISNFGHSLNKYWFPLYVRRNSNMDKKITN
ncbi:FYVE, RhoGEF and PH domain-containing protein 3 [Halyomorpha halys]|uniref:FYVE, RhoGEF and PH domain-containing protein 3 n=1 Tax=Halyomorpha halys TaxID=286706 RepID=UPI0006D4F313|nr:FYVE, RhoGEF and PH domain-containing protein 3 [Halyomorpha halys]